MEERQAYAETDDAVNAKPDYKAAAAYEKKDSFQRPDPSKMQDPVPLGIIVTDAPYIQKNELYPETVAILGFASHGKNKDNYISEQAAEGPPLIRKDTAIRFALSFLLGYYYQKPYKFIN